jgi:LuxR family maltose regulon positive regulatory protein
MGDEAAVKLLTEGAEEAAVFHAPAMEANCTAVLALIAHASGDDTRARALAAHARHLLVDHRLERAPLMAAVTTAHALAAARAGDPDTARSEWHLARAQLAHVKEMSGWANVQVRIALAHASLLLGDRLGAETIVRETHEYLVRLPDAAQARRQAADLEEQVRRMRHHSTGGSSALTTAELRVLHYLPTNLSLADISTRLYVSRYTVKTHCESIYRKLGASSRSQAVESARRLGLLGPDDHPGGV